jgi:tripartite-type tricarboxylate transporter receptor subunit TctC
LCIRFGGPTSPLPETPLADPALKDKLVEQGIVAVGSPPEEFRAFVGEEIVRWRKVITDAGIKMEP